MTVTVEALHEVGIRDLSNATSDCVNRVLYRGDVIYVTKNGRRVAALVPLAVVEAAERAEVGAAVRT
jgi:prevent-host-death family protein